MQQFRSGNNNHTNTWIITFFLWADWDIDLALVEPKMKKKPQRFVSGPRGYICFLNQPDQMSAAWNAAWAEILFPSRKGWGSSFSGMTGLGEMEEERGSPSQGRNGISTLNSCQQPSFFLISFLFSIWGPHLAGSVRGYILSGVH